MSNTSDEIDGNHPGDDNDERSESMSPSHSVDVRGLNLSASPLTAESDTPRFGNTDAEDVSTGVSTSPYYDPPTTNNTHIEHLARVRDIEHLTRIRDTFQEITERAFTRTEQLLASELLDGDHEEELDSRESSVATEEDHRDRLRASNVVDSLQDLMQIPTASTEDDAETEFEPYYEPYYEHLEEIEILGRALESRYGSLGGEDETVGTRKIRCPICSAEFSDPGSRGSNPSCLDHVRCSHGAMLVFTTLDRCSICHEEQIESPNVALGCGHVLCKKDFLLLGGATAASGKPDSDNDKDDSDDRETDRHTTIATNAL